MSDRSPLAVVTESFGGKDKLVDKLVTLLGSDAGESKDDLRKRLLGVANSKLLRMQRAATTVKEKFGSRDKLIEQAAAGAGRAKDKSYTERLDGFSAARLVAIAQAVARRQGAAAKAAATAAGLATGAGAKAGAKAAVKPDAAAGRKKTTKAS